MAKKTRLPIRIIGLNERMQNMQQCRVVVILVWMCNAKSVVPEISSQRANLDLTEE